MPGCPSLKPGDVVGNYRVVRLVGAGGMGEVYEVVHRHIARRAALKVLTFASARIELATRFVNEARAANMVSHPGIVQVFEYGQLGSGAPWLLMEFVEGETLGARIAGLRAGTREAGMDHLSALYQLAAILAELHSRGVVHRDLKPSNIILTPDLTRPEGEQAKLLDFGIAKLMHNSLRLLPDGRPADPGTVVGAFMGTAEYMAPEQCRSAADVDGQADVYAMGVIAYELLGGRLPFEGEPLGIVMRKTMESAPPLHAPDVPAELIALVMAMLQRDPTKRPTMAAISNTLARLGGRGLSGAQVRKLVSESAEHRGLAPRPQPTRLQRMLIGSVGMVTGMLLGLLMLLGSMYFSCGPVHGPADAGAPEPAADVGAPASAPDLTAPPIEDLLPPAAPNTSADAEPASPDLARPPMHPLANQPGHSPAIPSVKPPVHPVVLPVRPRLIPLTAACVKSLADGPKQAFVNAAAQVELRLAPGQSFTLVHATTGFFRCKPGTTASSGACDHFINALDALWDFRWPVPEVVEVKCPVQ